MRAGPIASAAAVYFVGGAASPSTAYTSSSAESRVRKFLIRTWTDILACSSRSPEADAPLAAKRTNGASTGQFWTKLTLSKQTVPAFAVLPG